MTTANDAASVEEDQALDVRREAFTMALYVAVCLLAAMIAVPDNAEHTHAIGIVWGISLGLVLAHLFAFRVSSRLVASGRVHPVDVQLAAAQLVGGAAVALAATVPVILLPTSTEVIWVELVMAALICVAGYSVAR